MRTADGSGIAGLVLLGITPNPDNQLDKIHKTALGAEKHVPYIIYKDVKTFISELKDANLISNLGALELTNNSYNLFSWNPKSYDSPFFIAVGHELLGVSSQLLVASEFLLEIPMNGFKESLNVAESSSILIYEFYRKYNKLGC